MKNLTKISQNVSKYLGIFIIASLLISPSFALAKNNKGNENKEKERKEVQKQEREQDDDKSEKKSENNNKGSVKKCFQAWGHLIAPGWIKWNGGITLPDNCIMPFGISKKFNGGIYSNGSTTPDTIAPIINSIVSTPGVYNAVLSWKTDEKSDTKVFYSTTSPVDLLGVNTYKKTNLVMTKDHQIKLTDLSANTTYYAILTSKDSSGNTATSSQISFTTLVAPADTLAPTISYVLATVGTTTVSTGWKTNEPATTKMYYSKISPVDPLSSTTPFVENTSLTTNHLISAYGLGTSTTYYILLESKDSVGNTQRTDQFSVITASGL